jgi:hypothetical protein
MNPGGSTAQPKSLTSEIDQNSSQLASDIDKFGTHSSLLRMCSHPGIEY